MNLQMRFLWYYQPISVGSYYYGTDGSLYSLPLAVGTEEVGVLLQSVCDNRWDLTCVCVCVNHWLPVVLSLSTASLYCLYSVVVDKGGS